MRKLKWKGLEAIPDKIGFRTYYRDGVKLSKEEVGELTLEQIAELTAPQNEEEWRRYYEDLQAEYEMEEQAIRDLDNN